MHQLNAVLRNYLFGGAKKKKEKKRLVLFGYDEVPEYSRLTLSAAGVVLPAKALWLGC